MLRRALLLSPRARPQRRPRMAAAAGRNREGSSAAAGRAALPAPAAGEGGREGGREADAPGPQRGRIAAAFSAGPVAAGCTAAGRAPLAG